MLLGDSFFVLGIILLGALEVNQIWGSFEGSGVMSPAAGTILSAEMPGWFWLVFNFTLRKILKDPDPT